MRYIILALVLTTAFLPDYSEFTLPVLAGLMAFFSIWFYWLIVSLLAGLKISSLDPEIDIKNSLMARFIHTSAAATLFLSGWELFAVFVLPWLMVNIATDLFAILVKIEVLDITDKDE